MKRGFIGEGLCELITRDFLHHNPFTEKIQRKLSKTEAVRVDEILRERLFGIDQSNVGENKAYYAAYQWLKDLLNHGGFGRTVTKKGVKKFIEIISQRKTTQELDRNIANEYFGYISIKEDPNSRIRAYYLSMGLTEDGEFV